MGLNQLVLTETIGPVLRLTLNRPERHNSLIPELLSELQTAFSAISPESTWRAVVLQAHGRSFSTGGDAQGFLDHADEVQHYAARIVGLLNDVILTMLDCPIPIITAVHGVLTGGSLGLVLASDIVLIAPEAWIAPYYSTVGPSPDGGWAVLLPRLIGRQRAAYVLFTNHHITAEEAVRWGLATMVVPAGDIHDRAMQIAQDIATKKPGSIRHTRQLLNPDQPEITRLLEMERAHFLEHIVTDEALGGFAQFQAELRRQRGAAV